MDYGRLEFHGSKLISDGDLLLYRELDDVLGLHDLAGEHLVGTGQNRLIKFGARVVWYALTITFQLAEVTVSGVLFQRILACYSSAQTVACADMNNDLDLFTRNRSARLAVGIDAIAPARPRTGLRRSLRRTPIVKRDQDRV